MKKARDLAGLSVRVRDTAAREGHGSVYALHAAMQEKGLPITYRQLCRIAAGDTVQVEWQTLVKICTFLDCQISDLFFVTTRT